MKRIYRLLALIAVILGAAGVYFIYFSSPAPVPRPMPKFVPKTGVAAKAPAPAAAPLPEQPVQPSRLFVADINNDGIDLKQGKGDYFFDTNADNLAEDIDWIAPSDAVLMTDCERNRPLRSLEELQKFDSNGDGRIDMNDRAFLNLTLWSDKNLNNLCEPGETRLLPDLRIKALVIENTDALKPVKIFNASARAVGFMEAAENIDLYEVNFTPLSVRKRYIGPREVSDEIAKLPNLNGLGSLVDLHYAAMADPGLADLLTQLKNLGNQDAGQAFCNLPLLRNVFLVTHRRNQQEKRFQENKINKRTNIERGQCGAVNAIRKDQRKDIAEQHGCQHHKTSRCNQDNQCADNCVTDSQFLHCFTESEVQRSIPRRTRQDVHGKRSR